MSDLAETLEKIVKGTAAVLGIIVGGSVALGVGLGGAQMILEREHTPNPMRPAENLPEHDRGIRKCDVYLIVKPVEGAEKLNYFAPTCHWSLLFDFEDGSVRILEGQPDSNGNLNAYILKESRPVAKTKRYPLAVIRISPYQLRDLAVKNPLNHTKYYTATNNCQNWVKELAKLLSNGVEEKLKYFFTAKHLNPITAYSWTATDKVCTSVVDCVKSVNVTHKCHTLSYN